MTSSMVFLRVLRLERPGGLLHKHFQNYDSVETFRNASVTQRQWAKAQGEPANLHDAGLIS